MKKIIIIAAIIGLGFVLTACSGSNNVEFDSSKNITVYTRDTSSGTRAGFMGGIDFKDAAENDDILVDGFVIRDNTGILTSMSTDEYGIGYISLASLNNTVKGLSFEGVEPTLANVIRNDYGLKRPFNYVLRSDWTGMETQKLIAEAFIAFLATSDGADVINDKGAIALPTTQTWDDIKDDYTVCSQDNSGVVLKFGGSDSIEKVAKALSESFAPKCGDFTPEHDHTGSSDGFKRTQGSESSGDSAKHIGFASRPFKTDGSEDMETNTAGQLAWDAIVAIVHLNNTLDNVTAADLKDIYSGTYTKWDELIVE